MKIEGRRHIWIYITIALLFVIVMYLLYKKYDQRNRIRANILQKLNMKLNLNLNKENIEQFENTENIKSNVDYQLYVSNTRDSYNLLNRDLNLKWSVNMIEHMESGNVSGNGSMEDLFPDLNKNAFSMSPTQSDKDLLVKSELEIEPVRIPDSIRNMDTRPDEQKELDSLLGDMNVYLYLLKKSILADLDQKRDIKNNQKISLYYSLFQDTYKRGEVSSKTYSSAKLTPGYDSDAALDKKVATMMNAGKSMIPIYNDILNKKGDQRANLEKIYIPTPANIGSED